MNRYAISFTVKPGTEPQVAEVLRSYRRPQAAAGSGGPPLLRRTSVFMAGQRVVRVIDVAGNIGTVMHHLATQPQIRAVEAALDPYLSTPRNLDSPEGVRAFLHSALLPPAGGRTTREVTGDATGDAAGDVTDHAGQRCGLIFPVLPGRGEAAARLLAGDGAPVSTTFRRGDVLVGLLETDGDPAGVLDHWAHHASRSASAQALAAIMATGEDLASEASFGRFLADCRMELLTDRRVGVPA